MKMKKKVLLSSVLTIALCLSLIAGSTFALFTSNSEVNIAVTAGNVNVVATVLDETLATYSMGVQQTKGTFENGGEALFDGASKLILNAVTPGDMATFKIQMENKSDVTIQYRVKWNIKGELADVLTATANGAELINNTTAWEKWTVDEATTKTIDVSVLLPIEVDDTYQNANADITFTVEAVQGNAVVTDVATVEQLKSALLMGESNISLVKDIELAVGEQVVIPAGAEVTLNMAGNMITGNIAKVDGHVIENEGTLTLIGGTVTSAAENGGSAIYNNGSMTINGTIINGAPKAGTGWPSYPINNYGTMTITDSIITGTHGAIAASNGASTILNNVTATHIGWGSSGHVIYLGGSGNTVVINGGTYHNNGNVDGSVIATGSGNTVVINDGVFTAANGGYGPSIGSNSHIVINGGTFETGFIDWSQGTGSITIYGGTFAKNPSAYIADGYKVIDNTTVDNTYIVTSEGNQTIVNSNGDTVIVPEIPEGASYEIIKEKKALTDAITSGKTYIFLEDGDYTLPAVAAGKALTIAGTAEVKIDRSKALGLNGSDLSFYGVTLTGENTNYIGYQHTAKESYTNCVIDNQIFCYAAEIEFVNCTFNQTSADAYNVWTYGSNTVSFTGCTFNSAGKALLIYSEGGATGSAQNPNEQDVIISNCVFNASAPVAGKAAIEIDSSLEYAAVNVTIHNTKANGFAAGSVSSNTLWNQKKGDKAVIMVDGVPTSTEALKELLSNAQVGDEIVLSANTTFSTISGISTEGVTLSGSEGTVVEHTAGSGALTGSFKNVTIKNITFEGSNAARWTYNTGDTIFENCVFDGDTYGYHVDSANDGTITFNNCTFIGFNAFASNGTYYFNNCTFKHSGFYGHTNMWGVGYFNNCTFEDKTSLSQGSSGTGTIYINGIEESYHHEFIGSAEALVAFADSVNNGGDSWAGQYVILINDIDLAGIDWEPIGQTGSTEFKGVFDGQGYTISNMTVDSSTETGANYSSGLFGWVESHGNQNVTIKNVNIENATVIGNHNCAVIVGYLYGTVENCHVSNSEVICSHYDDNACGDKAGIIVGYAGPATDKTYITDCSATNCSVSAGRDAGQLIGAGYTASISECSATNVTVTANGSCSDEKNINESIIGRVLG